MTVAELIAKLQEFPPDHEVYHSAVIRESPVTYVSCPYHDGFAGRVDTVVLS